MIELYRKINAQNVTKDYIILNHTRAKIAVFNFWTGLSVGLLMFWLILRYYGQDILELSLPLFLLMLVVILNLFKKKICYKKVTFDRKKQQVTIERNFLYCRNTYDYSKCEITNKVIMAEGGTEYYKEYRLYIKRNSELKKQLLCLSLDKSHDLREFFNKYMKIDGNKTFLKNLVVYSRDDDAIIKQK